jgi:hypothetical protein
MGLIMAGVLGSDSPFNLLEEEDLQAFRGIKSLRENLGDHLCLLL